MIKITQRDEAILHLLEKFGLLESRHIEEKVFKGLTQTVMYRRLRTLESQKLILKQDGLSGGRSCYSLTKLGASQIGKDAPPRFSNKNAFEHDLAVCDFRMVLEELGLGNDFTPEREIRKNFVWSRDSASSEQVIPDGILIEEIGGEPKAIALEMELNQKSLRRYIKILSDYRFMNSISYVWYVVEDLAIKNAVTAALKKVQRWDEKPRLLFTHKDDLFENKASALIEFEDGKAVRLSEFFNLKNKTSEVFSEPCESVQWLNSLEAS